MNDLAFYCWQLDLKTFGDLLDFKTEHKANTMSEVIRELSKEYNKKGE